MVVDNEITISGKQSESANSFLLQPQPTSPFPSPSSSFVPPPAQEAHEFANKTATRMAAAKQPRSATHSRRNSSDDKSTSQEPHPTPPDHPLPPPTPALKRFSADSSHSLSSSRPAPVSPALSRHSSLLHTGSKKRHSTLSIVSTSTPPPVTPTHRRALIKVRDFAFPPSDERHFGRWSPDKRDSRASSAGSGMFSRKRPDGEDSSSSDYHDTNSQDGYYDSDPDQSDEEESPFVPGIYRALYAFDPEGTAEMAMVEDQHVRVLGRGGGVGWVVVLKPDGVEQALVPEGYLELVRPEPEMDDDDEEESVGATEAPQTPRALS
ncbi:hypothetical protein CTheo_8010 [Ceratobasidium theobromae]|uniref:SH3 domain-containing protein n=1 Tax=Ceratobasidium theobromae TaxID=1582974 RepID=A0A5N5Q9W2_9AGAM|nr:hypothetical protein CTheo_8010 [Ceratobasidium theobromae]